MRGEVFCDMTTAVVGETKTRQLNSNSKGKWWGEKVGT